MTEQSLEALTEARINIAQLQAKVEAQGREIGELKAMVQAMAEQLNQVAGTLTEARGGWRALMLLGGAGAAFGGAFTWILDHLLRGGVK